MGEPLAAADRLSYRYGWTREFTAKALSAPAPAGLDPRPNSWQKWTSVALMVFVCIGGGLAYGQLAGLHGAAPGFMVGSAVSFCVVFTVMRRLGRSDHRARAAQVLIGSRRAQSVVLTPAGVVTGVADGDVSLPWPEIECITVEDWGAILWTRMGSRIPLPTEAEAAGVGRDDAVALIEKWSEPQ